MSDVVTQKCGPESTSDSIYAKAAPSTVGWAFSPQLLADVPCPLPRRVARGSSRSHDFPHGRRVGIRIVRDRLIALAEKHVSDLFEHRAERAEAEGNERQAMICDLMQMLLPEAVQILRSKKSVI